MPSSVEAICDAVRRNPNLLREWGRAAPPEAFLAGFLEEPGMWGAVPAEYALLVQAAAQLLTVVRTGRSGAEAMAQPAVAAWLKAQQLDAPSTAAGAFPEATGSHSSAFARLRKLAATALPAEVCKRVRHSQAWLTEFGPELEPVAADLAVTVDTLRTKLAKLPASSATVSADVGDAEGVAWLKARMTAAYLAGDEALSQDLRTALQALNSRR